MRPNEPVRVQESIEENKNEEEIMENINKEEDEETRIMRSRFEEILHTLTSSTKEILKRERQQLMKLKKGVAKDEINRVN